MAKKRKTAKRKTSKPKAAKSKVAKRKVAKRKVAKTNSKKSKPTKAKSKKPRSATSGKENAAPPASLPPADGASASASPAAGQGTVSVRMYRGLLGDFFLVKHAIGQRVFKMLIDCGVLQCIGTERAKPSTFRGKDRIIAGVADFMQHTGGQLDLVVATHEHYDHLSGFILANEAFKDLKISKVWMAWTEDRTDKIANGYRANKNKALMALAKLAENPALAAAGTDEIQAVKNLLQFHGGSESVVADAMGAAMPSVDSKLRGNASCEAALEWLRQKAGAGNFSFLKPGEVWRWGLDGAFRAYVLGPPRSDKLLRQLNPSKGPDREVYLARSEDVESVLGLADIHGNSGAALEPSNQPFTRLHWRHYSGIGKGKTKKATLEDPVVKLYRSKKEGFDRSIDREWLGSVESLALKIDGDVNNTSLALGLELSDKRILLFPGDAQVGNWLSWGSQTYPADDTKESPRLKVEDLLARTILYKVGHHASHNATLRERGLELMTNAVLCAMVPVVEKTAREQKTKHSPKGWAMPYGDLYKRLEEQTQGRILRGDGDPSLEKVKFQGAIFSVTYGEKFGPADPLWVEVAVTQQV